MLDLARFTHLTFDCYGTLVDWETGILSALRPVLVRHGVTAGDDVLLGLYAEHEARRESAGFVSYREVLRGVMSDIAAELGFDPSRRDLDALPESIGDWPPFEDVVDALERLHTRYRLAVLSNVDDDLFSRTAKKLGTRFDEVITAQQVGSYKPSLANFRHLLERLGTPPDRVLHVAQSVYHDHVPAKRLGLCTVRVDRPSRRQGVGLAPPADALPDLVVPDLRTLAESAGL